MADDIYGELGGGGPCTSQKKTAVKVFALSRYTSQGVAASVHMHGDVGS